MKGRSEHLERNTAIALPTLYRGVTFRSRLEARWAVFFDRLQVRWEYEKEGYDLNGVPYLPDFWLRNLECWVEIKPNRPNDVESMKASRLCSLAKKTVYLFYEPLSVPPEFPPSAEQFTPMTIDNGADEITSWDDGYWFCECPDCGTIGIQFEGRADRLPCKECSECWYWRENPDRRHLDSYDVHEACCDRKDGCRRHGGNGDKGFNYDSYRLVAAYAAARTERFGT